MFLRATLEDSEVEGLVDMELDSQESEATAELREEHHAAVPLMKVLVSSISTKCAQPRLTNFSGTYMDASGSLGNSLIMISTTVCWKVWVIAAWMPAHEDG